ncbi:MAG: SMC-Scp complex subunit ScpB [Spirochaetaceae bacterium]|jgi:segregation and condensation protein B|nr:SMC-Scp complex subunit ScpB [Spirochaetaceae bacterium]
MERSLLNPAGLIEAILYLETEPIDAAGLSRTAGLSRADADAALKDIENRYAREESGLEICRVGGGISIAPKKIYWDALRARYGRKDDTRLSRAALETLSIIAYSQPITRSEIEAIRGVQVDAMIRTLLDKGFIQETGRKDAPGKPVQFGTTKAFLQRFRLERIEDLPALDEKEAARFDPET